jgi:hypothetical protein
MAKANRKGRSVGSGRFVALHHFMLDTPAWQSLTPAERVLYMEVARLYDGKNNGALALSTRDAAQRCRMNKDTAAKAFDVLQKRGFIECVTVGGFSRKTRHAPEWRLTMHRCNLTGAVGSLAFQRWRPLPPETGQSDLNVGPKRGTPRPPETGQSEPENAPTVPNEGADSPSGKLTSVRNEGTHIHSSHRPPSDTEQPGGAKIDGETPLDPSSSGRSEETDNGLDERTGNSPIEDEAAVVEDKASELLS